MILEISNGDNFYCDPQGGCALTPPGDAHDTSDQIEVLRRMAQQVVEADETNKLSAPYRLPQFPLEQIESNFLTCQISVGPSVFSYNHEDEFEFEKLIPQYQRASISEGDITGVTI